MVGDLCHQRWRIEEAFKRIKHRLHLEAVSGLSQQALIIDVAAKILAYNITSLMRAGERWRPSVVEHKTTHFDAPTIRGIGRRQGVLKGAMEAEGAWRRGFTGVASGTPGPGERPHRIPLFDEQRFAAGDLRVIEPSVPRMMLGKVVLTHTILLVDLEDHQVPGLDGLRVAQGERGAWRPVRWRCCTTH